MDGYTGSNDILEKLKYANLGSPTVDLYWGDVRTLLEESELEIEKLRAALRAVMCWIEGWEPAFLEDEEWYETNMLVQEALGEKE